MWPSGPWCRQHFSRTALSPPSTSYLRGIARLLAFYWFAELIVAALFPSVVSGIRALCVCCNGRISFPSKPRSMAQTAHLVRIISLAGCAAAAMGSSFFPWTS